MECSRNRNIVINYQYENMDCDIHLFDTVSLEIEQERLSICEECPGNVNFFGKNNCLACECFISTITKSTKGKCPIGLW
jgi:hypothetical protein